MKSGSVAPEQHGSNLLTKEENEQVFRLLGPRCQTLATTVVQLYMTVGCENCEWIKRDAGVLCLVKDNMRRSYFFRLYCPARRQMVWEHEVYNNMEYLALRPFLHTFEADDCIAAFNFASEEEGSWMRGILLDKLETKKQRRERKSRSQIQQRDGSGIPASNYAPNGTAPSSGTTLQAHTNLHRSTSTGLIAAKSSKKKDKYSHRRLTKADIGTPSDFRHVSHVGWNANKGFDFENVEDPQLKAFLLKAGVSDRQMQDQDTRNFIYDFIEKHGGMDAVKEEIHPPPVPLRSTPVSNRAAPPPPPPPSRSGPLPPIPPPVPLQSPPPPPPLRTLPQRQVETTQPQGGNWVPPPPPPLPSVASPPPPPPPPPPALDIAPSAPAPASGTDPHSALMESIRSGKTLKHIDTDSKKSDSRGELLDQIRQGVELRSVQPVERVHQPVAPENSLAGALARALAERSRAIHSESSESSTDEEDDDEWED